jgi:hypothetical protein
VSLCKECKHRFRKVFTDHDISEDIIIAIICLVSDWDIGTETVYECSHYEPVVQNNFMNNLKELRLI